MGLRKLPWMDGDATYVSMLITQIRDVLCAVAGR